MRHKGVATLAVSALLLGAAQLRSAPRAAPAILYPAPDRQLGFLQVGPASGPSNLPQIVDAVGREVLLKGVNVDGLTDYYRGSEPHLAAAYPVDVSAYAGAACPPDDPAVEGVMTCAYDFDQLRPLGYNVVRLNLSWSLLEPTPGNISTAYIERIAQVVDLARAQGIYTILDMHQDAWSKYVYTAAGDTCVPPFQAIRGYDGAPLWASDHAGVPACALRGVRELDPAVDYCFTRLYKNLAAPDGVGLQDHYASLFVALARRFHQDPAVAGYEIINEPSPTPTDLDANSLFRFYGKVVDATVAANPGFKQLFFFEPNVTRDVTDVSPQVLPWSTFSAYPNAVYAPHVYTGVFTADQQVASQRFLPSDGGYNSAIQDAKALGVPLWIGEFGNDPGDDKTILPSSYQLQDKNQVGGAFWLWKENANDINGSLFWGVYGKPFPPGVPQPLRIKLTGRAYALTTAGHLASFAYDVDKNNFDLRATSPPVAIGDRAHATVIFIPANAPGEVIAEHAAVDVFDRGGGSREAYIYPAGGDYRVYLGAVSAALPSPAPTPSTLMLPNTAL